MRFVTICRPTQPSSQAPNFSVRTNQAEIAMLSGDDFLFTTYQAIEKGEPLRHRPNPSSPSPPAPSPAARPITPLFPPRQLSGDHFLFTTYQAIEKGEPLRHLPSPSSPSPPASSPAARPITPLFPPRQLSGDHFLFTTYQAIEKGEPLSISYVAKPTIDMVSEYGFVPSYNPFDTVLLFPSISYGAKPTKDMVSEYGFVPSYNPFDTVVLFPSISYGAKLTMDMVSEYGLVPSYNPFDTVVLFPSDKAIPPSDPLLLFDSAFSLSSFSNPPFFISGSARLVEYTGWPGEEEGEGQETQGEEGQGGDGQGEEVQVGKGQGEEGQRDGTSGDGSRGGEWWEGMESEEEEFESAKRQLVVWAGGHASPELLAMAAAVWHWIDTGRDWAGGHASPEVLAMTAAVWHWSTTGRVECGAARQGSRAPECTHHGQREISALSAAPSLASDGGDNGENVGAAAEEFRADSHGTEGQEAGASTADEPHDMEAQAADTWQQLAQSTSADILSSLSSAACAIQQRVRALLAVGLTGEEKGQVAREASEAESGGWSFSSDYYEDEDRLRELVACRGGRYRSASEILAGTDGETSGEEEQGGREGEVEEGEQTSGLAGGSASKPVCSPGVMRWVHERETVLQFQMVKKSILSEEDVAMGEWCRSMGRATS
ncbi:unnamed protein product [Closterium sp. Naga37s-1]|nr:unnamed protein product [Closterium sp. Naga37s-1]